MRRLIALVRTRFGLVSLACLVLAAWSLWGAGLFDSAVAQQLRSSATWIAPSYGVDRAQADAIVGNRKLVVVVQADDSVRARDVCGGIDRAADGTVAVILTPDEGRLRAYGCQYLFDGDEGEALGRAAVIETIIGQGVDEFAERPLEALKVVAVNYDLLVTLDRIPQGTRVIPPSFPRYVVALTAIAAVVLGSAGAFLAARRAGRLTAARQAALQDGADARSLVSARLAGVAQKIIDLDAHHEKLRSGLRRSPARAVGTDGRRGPADAALKSPSDRTFHREYLQLVQDYTGLLEDLAAADRGNAAAADPDRSAADPVEAAERAERLDRRASDLQELAGRRTHRA